MNCLLDTHTLLWWLFDDPKLSLQARKTIATIGNHISVSSASAWEIAIKHTLGKLPEIGDVLEKLPAYIRSENFEILPISIEHALAAGSLPGPHKDPFDRMLIAQARLEKLHIITIDSVFSDYHNAVIW